jgi:microcystin degradation protein MlrC
LKRVRVVVAEFKHETNCFCPNKAGRKEYEEAYLKDADEVIPYFQGTKTDIGGMIEASNDENFEIIPIMATFATPTGLTTTEMFEYAKNKIVRGIVATKNIDGILLSLHGAMVSETTLDAEGDLLRAIRKVVGSSKPIVATLDLHGNVTEAMVKNANAFFPYETYPHIDGYDRGYEAGKCIFKMIQKVISPVMKLRHVPILAQPIETASEPHVELLKKVHEYEANPRVINVAVIHGFAWSDIPEATMSVIAITEDDSRLAEDINNDLANVIWERRDEFKKNFLTPQEAVKCAIEFASGPVIIADAADNPGGGGTGDATFILRALLEARATDVGLALIRDPECVQQAISAGVGTKVKLSLGGKFGPEEITGGPVEIIATVKTITDGQFFNKGPMMNGLQVNMGQTVVLDADGIEIVVAERHIQAIDAEIFRSVGIEPAEKKIIVLKSAIHFKASFGPMARNILDVDTPEYLTMNFESLNFRNIARPVYPLDKDFDYIT